MKGLLEIISFSTGGAGLGLILWYARARSIYHSERRKLKESIDAQLASFQNEVHTASARAASLQKSLDMAFGFASQDSMRAFFELNDALSTGVLAARRLEQLAESLSDDSLNGAAHVFMGGELHLKLPRDGRTIDQRDLKFTLSSWRTRIAELLSAAQQYIDEALDQKNRFDQEQRRILANSRRLGLESHGLESDIPHPSRGQQAAAVRTAIAATQCAALQVKPARHSTTVSCRPSRNAGVLKIEDFVQRTPANDTTKQIDPAHSEEPRLKPEQARAAVCSEHESDSGSAKNKRRPTGKRLQYVTKKLRPATKSAA